jgi:hypothetical protein
MDVVRAESPPNAIVDMFEGEGETWRQKLLQV